MGEPIAKRWLAALRANLTGDSERDGFAISWIAYLETVCLNCAVGSSCAGLAPPLVPLEAALARCQGVPASDPSS